MMGLIGAAYTFLATASANRVPAGVQRKLSSSCSMNTRRRRLCAMTLEDGSSVLRDCILGCCVCRIESETNREGVDLAEY